MAPTRIDTDSRLHWITAPPPADPAKPREDEADVVNEEGEEEEEDDDDFEDEDEEEEEEGEGEEKEEARGASLEP
jgi:hypothetical protein